MERERNGTEEVETGTERMILLKNGNGTERNEKRNGTERETGKFFFQYIACTNARILSITLKIMLLIIVFEKLTTSQSFFLSNTPDPTPSDGYKYVFEEHFW